MSRITQCSQHLPLTSTAIFIDALRVRLNDSGQPGSVAGLREGARTAQEVQFLEALRGRIGLGAALAVKRMRGKPWSWHELRLIWGNSKGDGLRQKE